MREFEWMIDYTPQKEWVEKRGILTPIAFYSGSLGAGLYILSLYHNIFVGMIMAWLIVAIAKSFFHLADLYHPFRAFRMLARPQSSWISRGLLITFVFLVTGFLTTVLTDPSATNLAVSLLKIVSLIAAVGLSIYPGLVLRTAKGIRVWSSAWIPIIFLISGLYGGIGVIGLLNFFEVKSAMNVSHTQFYILMGLSCIAIAAFVYRTYHVDAVGKVVMRSIILGNSRFLFWLGILLAGTLAPIFLLLISEVVTFPPDFLLIGNFFSALIFGVCAIFVILRIGMYEPLV
jgi:formate-dependent nitrite reductase membrane component NrfD